MTYDKGIISFGRQFSASTVCDRDIPQDNARFEGEGGYDSDVLVGDEGGERVLRLPRGSLYGI